MSSKDASLRVWQPHMVVASLAVASLSAACAPGQNGDPLDAESAAAGLTATVTASSSENSTLGPQYAVDGNLSTRWSSAFSDPQWIQIDLGSSQAIGRVVLNWEAAYSKSYDIQFSNDGTTWTKMYGTTAGDGGVDDLAISGTARYVRMYSYARATAYGNSLWEFSVSPPATTTPGVALPARIEAEKYDRFQDTTAGNSGDAACSSTDVDAQYTTDLNGGTCNIAWVAAGEWLEYDVSVAVAGNFDITARLASIYTGKAVHVEIDGKNVTGSMTSPSAGWQTFGDVVARNIPIAAGSHKLRLVMDTGSTNVNYLNIQPTGTSCLPNCTGKQCGSDGCSGSCGTCASGYTCTASGACQSPTASLDKCKRGLGYGYHSTADLTALSKGISWWYNWSLVPDSGVASTYQQIGVEFVPQVWGGSFNVTNAINSIPQGARTLLAFNEPNFYSQSNLSPTQAAALWPQIQQIATARGLKIASPALNYCGGGCWETDPFVYFDKFFAACTNCQIDYLAVHWYACTVSALQNYINGMKKYNKPIWLTEFACGDGDTSLANQKAYMQAAIAYLESEPAVTHYAWFSGRTTAIPNVNLLAGSGVLTELGQIYVNAPQNSECAK